MSGAFLRGLRGFDDLARRPAAVATIVGVHVGLNLLIVALGVWLTTLAVRQSLRQSYLSLRSRSLWRGLSKATVEPLKRRRSMLDVVQDAQTKRVQSRQTTAEISYGSGQLRLTRHPTDVAVREQLTMQLDRARMQGRARRVALQVSLVGLGMILTAGGFASLLLLARHGSDATWFGPCAFSAGALLVMLALRPADRRAVDAAAGMACAGFFLLATLSALAACIFFSLWADVPAADRRGGLCERPFARVESPSLVPCEWIAIGGWSFGATAVVLNTVVLLLLPTLILDLPPRSVLDTLWRAWGGACIAEGVAISIALVSALATGASAVAGRPFGLLEGALLALCVELFVIGAVALDRDTRARVTSALSLVSEEVSTGAMIAAMLGSNTAAELQEQAEAAFRAITLDQLTFADLQSSKPDPALYARSVPARFGEVDAFISHSWHDDPAAKWVGLQAWRREFRARHHGREPTVWLDKASLDLSSGQHDARLAFLPLFLAGCNSLLALTGRTWLFRLWCVLEVFCYLEMLDDDDEAPPAFELRTLDDAIEVEGADAEANAKAAAAQARGGESMREAAARASEAIAEEAAAEAAGVSSPDRLNGGTRALRNDAALELESGDAAHASLVRAVSHFDVRASQASHPGDDERLLFIIEAGFGGREQFNQKCRRVLRAALEDDGERRRPRFAEEQARRDAQWRGATTIQAHFRSMRDRQRVAALRAERGARLLGPPAGADAPFAAWGSELHERLEASAVEIQRHVRGMASRRRAYDLRIGGVGGGGAGGGGGGGGGARGGSCGRGRPRAGSVTGAAPSNAPSSKEASARGGLGGMFMPPMRAFSADRLSSLVHAEQGGKRSRVQPEPAAPLAAREAGGAAVDPSMSSRSDP